MNYSPPLDSDKPGHMRTNQQQTATSDSEEAAQITPMGGDDIMDQQDGQQENEQSVTVLGNSGEKRKQINGHLDVQQRRIYLGVFMVALISALVGLVLLFIWMLHFRQVTGFGLTEAGKLANLHPILMYIFMVSLNMYAILIYRTHYYLPKDKLKWAHAILSGGNIVMSLLGVLAMYKSHLMAGLANFYSLHSWIGVTTNAFYLLQFIAGFIAFLRPGLAPSIRAKMMPWHRKMGTVILVLAAMAAITGIAELVIFQDGDKHPYSKFEPITYIANFAGMSVVIMTIATVYLVTASHYLRPSQPEELPLKR